MIAFIGSFIWLYIYAVNKTTVTTRVATLQTLATEGGKEMVLSITLKDGSNVKYLIKSPQAEALAAARKEGISNEKVSSYEISQLATALNVGESPGAAGPRGEDCRLTGNQKMQRLMA
jgi:hypothetical protein